MIGRRALVALVGALAVVIGGGQAAAAPSELFFSEYVEGTSNNKALEIFNGTGAGIDLSAQGYNVQMFFNGSTTAGLTINLAGTVASGDVFVLAHSAAGAAILAQADQTNGSGWFNGDDAVVLRKGTTFIDSIGQAGLDPGTEWGAGLTSTADNTLRRKTAIEAGDTNTGDAFDPAVEWDGFATDTFDGLGSHGGVVEAAPSVTTTTPTNGASNVALDANIEINFNEDVTTTGSWFSIQCAVSGTHTAAASGTGASRTLDPDANFAIGERCTVTVFAAQVSDVDVADPPDTMAADRVFSFTTVPLATTINQVQGLSHLSPLLGRAVSVEGIVTARRTAGGRGFWVQDPVGDGNDATSDGVFVFLNAVPTAQIGDRVRVPGTVAEFRGGCNDPCTPAAGSGFNNLTITQINSTNAAVQVLSSGNAVPAPVTIGNGGRRPPTRTIDDDTTTTRDVEVSNLFEPADDAIDFYESLEGMILRIAPGADVVGPTKSFGEITVLPNGGSWATGLRTPRGGILYAYSDGNPERIQVDDEILRDLAPAPRPGIAMPNMDVGARVTNAIVGPLDYTFANYKLQATTTPTFVASTIAREQARTPRPNELTVATFNVENLTVEDPQAKFDQLAGIIVGNLKSPDLIGIEEVQDDDGETDSGNVVALQTWARLIAAIQAAGGPTYDYRQIDPVNNADGGAPGGNIRVGFLFRTDRGLAFVDRPGGDSTTPVEVVAAGPRTPALSISPGRIDPANPAYEATRKSLAGEFTYRGRTFFAVVVHFSSKGADQPLFGRFQPPTRFSEQFRHGQAQVVNDFVDEILAIDDDARVVVLGDINDFEFSRTVEILEGRALETFMGELNRNQRYSYVFEGNSQTLDQILGTDEALDRLVEYDVVRVNAEFAVQASDHDPSVARIRMAGGDDDDDDDDDDD